MHEDHWPSGASEMARLIRVHDWAPTPLGPIAGWPQSLKTVVDLMLCSPSMMSLVWGAEAIHIYNDSFTELLREHRTLALGRSAYETFARSRDAFEADISAGMAGRSARLLAQRYPVLRQGRLEQAWFDVDYVPVRDEAGIVAGVLWTLRETTEQHLAEQALAASEARGRLLIESWAQAVWEVDADGAVVTDSPTWRAYTGQTYGEFLGDGWLNAIHPDDRAYAERQWREAVAACAPVNAEFRLRAPDGGWRWTNVRAAPVLDSKGGIEKWFGMNIDINARKRVEAALRESEELRRIAVEGGGMGTWRWDLRDKLIWGDAAFLTLWGFSPSDEPRQLIAFTDRMSPKGQAEMGGIVTRAIAAGEEFDGQLAVVAGPTEGRWVRWRGRAEKERPWIVNGVSFDVTEQRLGDERLRESEGRLRALVEGMSQLVWRAVGHGDWIWASPQWAAFTGQSEVDSHHQGWLAPLHPDDRAAALAAWGGAEEIGGLDVEYRISNASTGEYRWFQTRAAPLRGTKGEIVEWLGTSTDVHDLKALQESQAVMVKELQHRTRNLIAVVRGIADDTMGHTGPGEGFRAAFSDRLSALSRVQGLLSRAEVEPITLAAVVRLELDALGAVVGGMRVLTAGPEVSLRPSTVQTLALALHELATNARKYGALSHEHGQLAVTWSERAEGGERRLLLDWTETGLEQAPARSRSAPGGGYGRELIERALPYALGARTTYALTAEGVRCTIDLPSRPDPRDRRAS